MSWFGPQIEFYEEEASPKSVDDYLALSDACFEGIQKLLHSDEWIPVTDEKGVQMFEMDDNGAPIPLLRIETVFEGTPEELNEIQSSFNLEERKKYDPDIKELELLEKITDELCVLYSVVKTPSIVSDRDFAAFRMIKQLDDGTICAFGHTINHSKKPITSQAVRAKGLTALYMIPIDGGARTKAIKIMKIDPMGSIPKWVINMGKKNAAVSMRLTVKYFDSVYVASCISY
eukprot:TRINITY_DN6662_c0_g1_i2.p1 TRINITY_DN6662_c0_g1~~TRINITY_DN6662_c0_g1_i2.p1  ORF type:complete len:231 (+),score=64.55 TRINITY_DN6662_c0_g1_i2:45-737(+)